MVWYSHLLKNFPQFIVIHTVKGFGIVDKAEIYVFLELSSFIHDPADVGTFISGGILESVLKNIFKGLMRDSEHVNDFGWYQGFFKPVS